MVYSSGHCNYAGNDKVAGWNADTVADSERGEAQPAPLERMESKPGASVFRVGVPWTYVEFIREAFEHGRP